MKRNTLARRAQYVLREVVIAIAINSIFSAVFAYIVFGDRSRVDLWGWNGLAVDFVPQTFILTVMTVVATTLVTRQSIRSGKVSVHSVGKTLQWLPVNLGARSVLLGVAATILFGGLVVCALSALWSGANEFAAVLLIKVTYGAIVAALVAWIAIERALSMPDEVGRHVNLPSVDV